MRDPPAEQPNVCDAACGGLPDDAVRDTHEDEMPTIAAPTGQLPSAGILDLMDGMAMLKRPDSRLGAVRYLDLP